MIRISPTYCYLLRNAFVILFCFVSSFFEFHTEVSHTQSIVHTYTKKKMGGAGVPLSFNIVVSMETGSACSLKSSEDLSYSVSFHLSGRNFLSYKFCSFLQLLALGWAGMRFENRLTSMKTQ